MEQFTVENLYGNNKKTVDNKTQKAINLSFYLYTILFLDEDNLSPFKLKQQQKKKYIFSQKLYYNQNAIRYIEIERTKKLQFVSNN